MKTMSQIKLNPRIKIIETDGGGGACKVTMPDRMSPEAVVVFSRGGGWDHVSISFANRCPSWEEMCYIKSLFFLPEECVIQYHPPESEYVRVHPYCLHLWRPQQGEIARPPQWMVG